MSAFRVLGPVLVLSLAACGASTSETGETRKGNTGTSAGDSAPTEVDAATIPDGSEDAGPSAASDDSVPPAASGDPPDPEASTSTAPPTTTNPPATAPVSTETAAPETSDVGAACVASNSMRGVRVADALPPEFPVARCVDLSTSSTLPEYVEDQDWQAQVLMRASDFDTQDGPWQLERIAGTDVLASNALGEQALLAFAMNTGICYFDQAREQGLQVRAIYQTRVLACDGERCIVADMPSPGTLDLDEPLIELPDEGYDRLFHAEPFNLSLSNGEKVLHLCGGFYSDAMAVGWRAPYAVETEVALEDYLQPVRELCDSPDTLFLSEDLEEPYPSVLFGLKDGKGFLFTDRPADMSLDKLDTPRCEPLDTELDVLDGQVYGFFAGPHVAKTLTSFLTSSELRGHVASFGFR